jgi:hypothetical protein
MAALARRAVAVSPESRSTGSPVASAVATTAKGTGDSSRRSKARNDSRTRRIGRGSNRWPPWRSRLRASGPRLMPSTSRRRREAQKLAISPIPSRSVRLARKAPLIAPTDVPTIIPGRMPLSMRAWIMPTCIAPRLPPPLSTNAGAVESPPEAATGRDLALSIRAVAGSSLRSQGLPFGDTRGILDFPQAVRSAHLLEHRRD